MNIDVWKVEAAATVFAAGAYSVGDNLSTDLLEMMAKNPACHSYRKQSRHQAHLVAAYPGESLPKEIYPKD
jgi:hypothetical protein